MKSRLLAVLTLFCSAAGAFAAPAPARRPAVAAQHASSVAVLGYGAIGSADGALGIAEFSQQMRYLQSAGLKPVSLDEFLSWRAGLAPLPEHAVLLTFDQVDAAFVREVFPVLQACRFPFLVFVDARKLGATPQNLSERDLQMLVRQGATVGCHSGGDESAKRWQAAELQGNKATLAVAESELGAPARRLRALCGGCDAYSHGSRKADVTLLRHLVRHGFAVAFSRTDGKNTPDTPSFMLPRYMVDSHLSFARAVNFGPKGQEVSIAASMEDSHADHAVPADAMAIDFENDAVAEEVDDAPPAAPAKPEESGKGQAVQLKNTVCGALHRAAPGEDWRTGAFDAPLVPREQTRVAVLGYHNFSNVRPATEMRMRTGEFCRQMQYIKDAGLSVISMQDFIEWRFGDRCLPERCVLITIDDGWKSVYTDAYPVLKAYGYPFTIFLYTRYINVLGDSMTSAQIAEMLENGATVGSHSTNHLYPRSWKKHARDSQEYADMVKKEILDSGVKLRGMFASCSTYCYPGGYNTPEMIAGLAGSPYKCAFTVLERKVDCTEAPWLVHRYMVFGIDPSIFRRAVNFDGDAGVAATRQGIEDAIHRAREFFPKAFVGLPGGKTGTQSVSDQVASRINKTRNGSDKNKPSAKGKKPSSQPAPASPKPTETLPSGVWWQ